MKKLDFQYNMKISLDVPVNGHRFTLRCTPPSDDRQRISRLQITVSPYDFLSSDTDPWGNTLLFGSCRTSHQDFSVSVCGQAETGLCGSLPQLHPRREDVFRYETPLTRGDAALAAFADRLPTPTDVHSTEAVMTAVYRALEYRSGSTDVKTTAAEAFRQGCGVCQDYSQIMLAVLRRKRIPARYVVGMLMGEGKSHAWVEVLLDGRWYAFDPTNNLLVTDEHIKLSHGRDYTDCMINRGIFLGFCRQTADIRVSVTEVG